MNSQISAALMVTEQHPGGGTVMPVIDPPQIDPQGWWLISLLVPVAIFLVRYLSKKRKSSSVSE
jgi:hypothetical protein